MSKKIGKALKNMPFVDYQKFMGGIVEQVETTQTGYNNPITEVQKYYRILREYAVGRFKWTSDTMTDAELRLIEWHIFHKGYCAIVKPKIKAKGGYIITKDPKVFNCVFSDMNQRTLTPDKITISNYEGQPFNMCHEYARGEFAIISDDFLHVNTSVPFSHTAWEFANKLYELDLAFNANSVKSRLPAVFNPVYGNEDGTRRGNKLAELFRSALGRNEQFVEVDGSMVGPQGLMHEPKNTENRLLEYIEAQKKLYQAYLELLGLYTNKEKSGVYTVKDLQENGDESGDFITKVAKENRLHGARQAAEKFGINLSVRVM